jgi:hypothetical protein
MATLNIKKDNNEISLCRNKIIKEKIFSLLILCSFKNKFMFKLREDKKNKA